eukprot:Tamp_14233.p1 GENE.Tamp_14233~~Tamp_14233.p1  ORF type:complete len:336 (+),score=97.91 Tamp_14233:248-1255(+)
MPPKDLAECWAVVGRHLRFKCKCPQCFADKDIKQRPRQGVIDLAELLAAEVGSDEDAVDARPGHVQKVSVVPRLPMPAGGFCRRSAAAQWALAQEMSRQNAGDDDEDHFDCAEHDWPELFQMDLLEAEGDDFGFDFELIDAEDADGDEVGDEDLFVLEMVGNGEDGEDGWANLTLPAKAEANAEAKAETPGAAASSSAAADMIAAANALKLDFKQAVCVQAVPQLPRARPSTFESAVTPASGSPESEGPAVEEWPVLSGGTAVDLSSSPTCVSDAAGQWVSVVEKSKEPRVPAVDKKSRNFREKCKRTVVEIRRAEMKAARKTQRPKEEFPPLPA